MPDLRDDNVHAMWSEDDLDRALAALRPADDLDDPAFQRVRTEVLAAAGGPAPAPAPARRRRPGKWLATVGTVAAVVAGLLVVQTVQFDGTFPNAAAEQLNQAAAKVTAADEPLGPGQYRYIATHAWWMSNGSKGYFLEENLLETWVPADQEQEWLWRRDVTGVRKDLNGTETTGHPNNSGSLEGEWRARCGDWFAEEEGQEPCRGEGNWSKPDAEFLASLPRHPDVLYDRLRRDTAGRGQDPDLEMVVYVADVLRSGLVPADLRAALYRALAKVPGLEITEQVANVDGRKGTAYGIGAKGERHDIIVDPATGQFIGERQIADEGYEEFPVGTVLGYTSVSTAVVSGMGVRPAG